MPLRLDYTNFMAEVVSGGISSDHWRDASSAFARAHAGFGRRREADELGFLDLPGNAELHRQSTDFAARVRGQFDDVVVLGIGGSALGPIALRTALLKPQWNALTRDERGGWPRLHVLDNVDPRTIAALLDRLDLSRALFIVISKSGGTAETMAQYLVIRARLQSAVGSDVRRHLVFVTDPEKGALRTIARAENIPALDIPPNVGGRYSVLTPVGILPAALTGMDTAALLAGASEIARRCDTDALARNPAGTFAMLQFLADTKLGRHIHVLMPYSDPLRDIADWFVQLWAESLGKHKTPNDAGIGPTPLGALGATDQHSKVQLFMEGPPDKTVSFIAVDEEPMQVEIPRLHADVMYGINPLDQPGVELGKQFTYAMLGRADAEQARREWNMLPKPDERFSV